MYLAATVGATTPWWGSGLFTLLGAVLGGVVVQIGNVYVHRRRSRVDQVTSDRRQRREALIDYVTEANRSVDMPRDKAARTAFQAAYVRLELTLSEPLRELAHTHYLATYELLQAKLDRGSHAEQETLWLEAEAELIRTARGAQVDLGLPKQT
jgi:hypothetical protein